MRGEFIRGDGTVIPNNVTNEGKLALLRAGFQGEESFVHMGLCQGQFAPDMTRLNVTEPATAQGYALHSLAILDDTHWSTVALTANGAFVESRACVFEPMENFSVAVDRLFLCLGNAVDSDLFALSAQMPSPVFLTPTTPLALRTFRYRLYL